MTRHDDPDTTTPIDTTTGQAPVSITRDELIELCEAAIVPTTHWSNRDSASAQEQIGKAWALLRAGADWELAGEPRSDDRTWWVEITYRGFAAVDWGGPDEVDTFYIPTRKRLDQAAGKDWY